MVEILIILALVGVLMIVGIYSYTQCMIYYRSNEILNEVNMISLSIINQIETQGYLPDGEEYETGFNDRLSGGHLVTVVSKGEEETFSIYVDNVPDRVCARLVGLSGKKVTIALVEDEAKNANSIEHSDIEFEYYNWADEEELNEE